MASRSKIVSPFGELIVSLCLGKRRKVSDLLPALKGEGSCLALSSPMNWRLVDERLIKRGALPISPYPIGSLKASLDPFIGLFQVPPIDYSWA